MQKLAHPGFWMSALLVLVALGVQTMLAIPLAIADAVLKLVLHKPTVELTRHALCIGCINLVSFSAAIALGLFLNRLPFRKAYPLTRITVAQLGSVVVLILGIDVGLSEVDNVIRAFLPPPEWVLKWLADSLFHKDRLLSTVFLLVMVAPLTEELLFRGIILRGLLNRFRPGPAIVMTAVLFAAGHVNPWQFFSALFLGLALGWFYVRTGSILLCVLAHAFTNAMSIVFRMLPWSIPGMTGDDLTIVEFQPWWLDLTSVALVLAGIWTFRKATPFSIKQEVPAPPIIPPGGTVIP